MESGFHKNEHRFQFRCVCKRAIVDLSFLFIFISENRCAVLCVMLCVCGLTTYTHTKNAKRERKKKNSINNKCDDSIELTHIPSEIQIKTWS